MTKKRFKMSPVKIVAAAFVVIILIGTLLLMCPFSSKSGEATRFIDALFTSTSATCVTGLAVVDTASHWSAFGKAVILILIQIGGLGAMTIVTAIIVLLKGQVSLQDSKLLMQSAGTLSLSGVIAILKRIFLGTLIFESAGAVLLATQFIPAFGWGNGILKAIFHSVSAFCNAGFDIMGDYKGGASLSAFDTNVVVNFTVMALIVIGGLGFVVWSDLYDTKYKLKKPQFHTKIVLITSLVLLVGGAVLYYIFEYNAAFAHYTWYQKIMAALFQSVTTRTAGFAMVPMDSLSDSGSLLTVFLMMIGGSPGSTAGGMKTTTLAVLVISACASARKLPQRVAFKRSIDDATVQQAVSITVIYIAALLLGTMFICAVEPFPLKDALLEVSSAIGTVGLSTGITSHLEVAAKFILTVYMFVGRIGGLSMAIILSEKRTSAPVSRPAGKILIG